MRSRVVDDWTHNPPIMSQAPGAPARERRRACGVASPGGAVDHDGQRRGEQRDGVAERVHAISLDSKSYTWAVPGVPGSSAVPGAAASSSARCPSILRITPGEALAAAAPQR